MFTKRTVTRVLVYISGLCILALGLTLSTKADLGVSPIIAVSFCISKITGARFGDMTFFLYASFVVIEILLHLIPGKRRPADMPFNFALLDRDAAGTIRPEKTNNYERWYLGGHSLGGVAAAEQQKETADAIREWAGAHFIQGEEP